MFLYLRQIFGLRVSLVAGTGWLVHTFCPKSTNKRVCICDE